MGSLTMTVREVSEALGISPSTVAECSRDETLPSFRAGSQVLFPRRAIEHLAAHGRLPEAKHEPGDSERDAARVLMEARLAGLKAEAAALESALGRDEQTTVPLRTRRRRVGRMANPQPDHPHIRIENKLFRNALERLAPREFHVWACLINVSVQPRTPCPALQMRL